jgi:hypothetical protein
MHFLILTSYLNYSILYFIVLILLLLFSIGLNTLYNNFHNHLSILNVVEHHYFVLQLCLCNLAYLLEKQIYSLGNLHFI